jgi:hypothetical protein
MEELPVWAVKDGLDKELKDMVIGRLNGEIEGAVYRQDLVDSYFTHTRRSARLGHINHLLQDLLFKKVQSLVYKSGGGGPYDGQYYYSLNINGRKYLYKCATDRSRLICPWDIKELEVMDAIQ